MQNKPNFQKDQMSVSAVLTNDYDNWTLGERGKNKPNTNPIQTQYKPNTNPIKPNSNPIQTQYKRYSDCRTSILRYPKGMPNGKKFALF